MTGQGLQLQLDDAASMCVNLQPLHSCCPSGVLLVCAEACDSCTGGPPQAWPSAAVVTNSFRLCGPNCKFDGAVHKSPLVLNVLVVDCTVPGDQLSGSAGVVPIMFMCMSLRAAHQVDCEACQHTYFIRPGRLR